MGAGLANANEEKTENAKQSFIAKRVTKQSLVTRGNDAAYYQNVLTMIRKRVYV